MGHTHPFTTLLGAWGLVHEYTHASDHGRELSSSVKYWLK